MKKPNLPFPPLFLPFHLSLSFPTAQSAATTSAQPTFSLLYSHEIREQCILYSSWTSCSKVVKGPVGRLASYLVGRPCQLEEWSNCFYPIVTFTNQSSLGTTVFRLLTYNFVSFWLVLNCRSNQNRTKTVDVHFLFLKLQMFRLGSYLREEYSTKRM